MTAKDHKRKARAIAPATVRCGDGWIEVVVPDVLGKNESHVAGRGGQRHTSSATKRYRESMRLSVIAHIAANLNDATAEQVVAHHAGVQAMTGAWRLEVLGVWPRRSMTMGFECPMGDADAAIPQALDALQHAGILDNDARVVEARGWNMYRKDVRCTVIRLVRVPDLAERDAAIAHLVAHVPASPEPAPKATPKPKRLRGLTKPRKEPAC